MTVESSGYIVMRGEQMVSAQANDGDSLIIVGSGNVAYNVYRIAEIVGYRITVIDNRVDTLTEERFPAADRRLGNVLELLRGCDIHENTSIVLASYNHEFDDMALQAVIKSPARYIGILGNKHKVTAYFKMLKSLGISDELISRVHIPIGLDLGGQKAAEIALAAVAEIQAVKYGRSGGFVVLQQDNDRKSVTRDELF
ncbi:MAG: XdhC family protein [Syntrophomonadaceae bacterium]|jgi:xanthine dehydrogenase accessory factor